MKKYFPFNKGDFVTKVEGRRFDGRVVAVVYDREIGLLGYLVEERKRVLHLLTEGQIVKCGFEERSTSPGS